MERMRARTRSFSRTFTQTFKQVLVPILKWREVIRSITFCTREEQVYELAKKFPRFNPGEGFLYIPGHGVEVVRTPLPREPYARSPRTLAKVLSLFRSDLLSRPMYHCVESVVEYRSHLLPKFLDCLAQAVPRIEHSAPPQLSPPIYLEADQDFLDI